MWDLKTTRRRPRPQRRRFPNPFRRRRPAPAVRAFRPLPPPRPRRSPGPLGLLWGWLRGRVRPLRLVVYATLAWLALGVAIEGVALWRSPLAEVELHGNAAVSAAEIVAAAGLRRDQPLNTVDPLAATDAILALPRVRSADVRREFPGRVVIRLEERRPVARVRLADGSEGLIDREGVFLGPPVPAAGDEPAALPAIRGLKVAGPPGSRLDDPVLDRARKALRLVALLEPGTEGGMTIDAGDPFTLVVTLPHGRRLLLPADGVARAVAAYRWVPAALEAVAGTPRVVDLRMTEAPAGPRIVLH